MRGWNAVITLVAVLVLAALGLAAGLTGCGSPIAEPAPGPANPAAAITSPTATLAARTVTATPRPTVAASITVTPSRTVAPIEPTSSPQPVATLEPTPIPRFAGAIDLTALPEAGLGVWFEEPLAALPTAALQPEGTFAARLEPAQNRRDGVIAPTLVGGYVYIQFGEATPALLAAHIDTIGALFIRSALLSFVDYGANRVLDWDRISMDIPMDVRGMIGVCNEHAVPVYLEINYSDYVPGLPGTGVEALQQTDNIERTIAYLSSLEAQGLHVAGVTFGDEIGDEAGFGVFKPTLQNCDLMARFVAFARALKDRFPDLKIYAFDSYIAATRGEVSTYLSLLRSIRAAEIEDGRPLLDGFVFRESYTYMDERGVVLPSQQILDDTESLYRDAPVYRYDVFGNRNPSPDRDYLHLVLGETYRIFGRPIDIGLTEYLPAGPVQISENDTSSLADIDFIIHYADVVGIYAELGLDVVSTFMFQNEVQQAKCYIDKQGNAGVNYPVHAQLAQQLQGELLTVDRSTGYEQLKVKVYVARQADAYFVMILNKDATEDRTVRMTLPGVLDLTMSLPRRSYTGLVIDGDGMTVSG